MSEYSEYSYWVRYSDKRAGSVASLGLGLGLGQDVRRLVQLFGALWREHPRQAKPPTAKLQCGGLAAAFRGRVGYVVTVRVPAGGVRTPPCPARQQGGRGAAISTATHSFPGSRNNCLAQSLQSTPAATI